MDIQQKTINTIRTLSVDMVQKANSGHPGAPMGMAPMAYAVWADAMSHNPKNPNWHNRDRFVLSNGHASALLYSLLHLFGYGLTMDDLKQFRQWGAKTPGHPEYKHTPGVETTTGPLGQGIANAVGFAIAETMLAAKFNKPGFPVVDHRVYTFCGDGCMMEGSTQEAASLAGHLKLDNIIAFYDSNSITIEGSTSLAFSDDTGKRFEAMGWRVLTCADANDIGQCDAVLAEAVKTDGRPTLIIGKTVIGAGAPNKQGKASCHGEALGEAEVAALKEALDMPQEAFYVDPEVLAYCRARAAELVGEAAAWDGEFQKFIDADRGRAEFIGSLLSRAVPDNIEEELLKAVPLDKPAATRVSGGLALQRAAALVPSLIGGSADLAPSNKTNLKDEEDFTAENRSGRNLHFGVRELGMALAGNGIALHGGFIPFTSTFFVFSDYMKPAIRLAALQKLHQIYVFTHDSFYVGEDGPTHEPVEQLAMLRSIPGLTVIRPGDAHEVAGAWSAALKADGPVALLLTRQDLEPFAPEQAACVDVSRGAYVISDDEDFDIILIATGSEVNLALRTADMLRQLDVNVRVVSMPSQELFLKQDEEYRESVLPSYCACRVSIEAGTTFGWHRFVGIDGLAVGIDTFGASAPYKVLAEKFGFTPEAVVARISGHFIRYDEGDDDDCGCEDGHCGCEGGHCHL